MSWPALLQKLAIHAAVAGLVVALLLDSRLRRHAGRALDVLGRVPRGRFVVALLALTALVRVGLLLTFTASYTVDIREYVEKARLIAEEGHPRAQEVKADGRRFYRSLGYPLALAGWFKATGRDSVRSAQVFGILLALVTAWLVLRLGDATGLGPASRLAALLYALDLHAAIFAVIPYSEVFATLLVLLVALAFEAWRRADGTGRAIAAGAGLGIAEGLLVITRPEYLWTVPLSLVLLLVARPRPAPSRFWLALPAFAVLLVAPWLVNSGMRSGYPGVFRTSVQGPLLLYYGNNPIEVSGHGNATPEVIRRVEEMYEADPTGATVRREALAWMRANPGAVIANMPKKLYWLWLGWPDGFGWRVRRGEPDGMARWLAAGLRSIAWVQALAVLGLGIAGLVRFRRELVLPALVVALHLGMFLILPPVARNRLPVAPLLMLAAAAWVVSVTAPRPAARS